MKILAVSDIHANWPALEAVIAAESFDRLLVGGDLISYGPHPWHVVDFVRRHATVAVRGNHDEALAHDVDCRCAPSSKPLAEATRAIHRTLLSSDAVEFLGALPLTAALEEAGHSFFCVHASPLEHLYRYTLMPEAPDDHLRHEIASVHEEYVLLGHTHFPMARLRELADSAAQALESARTTRTAGAAAVEARLRSIAELRSQIERLGAGDGA